MPIAANAAAVNFLSAPRFLAAPPPIPIHFRTSFSTISSLSVRPHCLVRSSNSSPTSNRGVFLQLSVAGGDGGNCNGGWSGGHGGGGGNDDDDGENSNSGENKKETLMALGEAGRSLESLPKDLKAAIKDGRIPASIVQRYLELQKSKWMSWLLRHGGFKERLLADDLFLTKVFIECGVGLFTKTAAEFQRRGENFFNELDVVFADVVMAIVADFMLVYLPAPTVPLRPPIQLNAGRIAKFFHSCPDNAFQVALGGTSFSLLQRLGAIARNGSKLFVVGTASSLVGTVVTNAFINARRAVDKSGAEEVENNNNNNVPILSTAAAYGVYMSISSNLRYQVLAGVIEQRILEPLLHQHKSVLSAVCFAVRTGNTFMGSLLWVDYARWIGLQKSEEIQATT
ncbi:PREDICTED: protein RETICULATA-RELATED 4, chloroplastic-like [Ipomoea nil]|uniref:protein RETICULATA-RELATED 4, chloroplastic-like n=1 Tax=Ipomoea nil TaxID=35883 RepID=UPI000900D8E3|nr:PREDICTED: protein RETICULATA-RELATED 4, chloroplastic-like [Ipomoea nil]